MSETKERKQYTVRFPHEAVVALDNMSHAEDVSIAELIRRAVNFYQIKQDAKKHNKKIFMEREDGVREWVTI